MRTAQCSSTFIESLASRRRFGMRPGLDAIRALCGALGDPQDKFRAIHVAGTNGKGAVCAMLSAVLGGGRYTSPHLIKINERFVINGQPISDEKLEYFLKIIHNALNQRGLSPLKPPQASAVCRRGDACRRIRASRHRGRRDHLGVHIALAPRVHFHAFVVSRALQAEERDGGRSRFQGGPQALPSVRPEGLDSTGGARLCRRIRRLHADLEDGRQVPVSLDHVVFRVRGNRKVHVPRMAQGRRRPPGNGSVDGSTALDHDSQLRRLGGSGRFDRVGVGRI